MAVTLGSTVLLNSGRLTGQRIGIVSNPASVDHHLHHIVDLALADTRVRVTALFGPQHGFRSDVQDNMIETPHAEFEGGGTRRIPLFSLYSDTREPSAEMLRDVDTVVIDLQDIGTRIYTYAYTMANRCARASGTEKKSSSAIGPTRSAATTSRASRSSPAASPSSACSPFPLATA